MIDRHSILCECLLDCGGDIEAAFAAAEQIVASFPDEDQIDPPESPEDDWREEADPIGTSDGKPVDLSVEDEPRDELGRWTTEDKELSAAEASALIAKIRAGDKRSKNKGEVRPESISKPQLLTTVSLKNIPEDVIRQLEESTDPKRVAEYAKQQIDTPVVLIPRRKASGFGVSDGGHRLLAAIKRGDSHIRAMIPADAKDRLVALSIDAFFAYDIHNRKAQGILNRSIQAAKGLSSAARKDLQAALKKSSISGEAILNFIDKYRVQLAKVLTNTQLAALLEGAHEVAVKVPPLGEVPVEGLPVKEQERIIEARRQKAPPITVKRKGGGEPEDIHLVTIEEAVKNLQERDVMDRQQFDELDAAARAKAFTVANVAAEETLTKIRDSLAKNMEEGVDYATWSKKVLEDVDQGTFLSDAHQETVFRTNVQTAFSDGQAAVLAHPLVRSGFPYSAYDSIHDSRRRPNHGKLEHLGINGTNVYRNDDPVFQMFRPPWDFNDRCSWTPITVRQAAERGIKEAQIWLDTGVEPASKAFVPMPDFRPPPGFQRSVAGAPLSIQMSLQPMATFSTKPEEEPETSELFGQPEVGSIASATLDTAKEGKGRMKVAKAKTAKGRKIRRSLFKRLRVKKKWAPAVSLAVDVEGHQHRGKGKGGGQFVSTSSKESNDDVELEFDSDIDPDPVAPSEVAETTQEPEVVETAPPPQQETKESLTKRLATSAVMVFRSVLERLRKPPAEEDVLTEIRPQSYAHHEGMARAQIESMGVKPGESLNGPTLRAAAVANQRLFDAKIGNIEGNLLQARHFATPEQSVYLTNTLNELLALKDAVNTFRAKFQPERPAYVPPEPPTPEKPIVVVQDSGQLARIREGLARSAAEIAVRKQEEHHKGERRARVLNTQHALEHLARGVSLNDTVAAVMKFGRLKEASAKRYVRAALTIADEERREREANQ